MTRRATTASFAPGAMCFPAAVLMLDANSHRRPHGAPAWRDLHPTQAIAPFAKV
jgi:hypothetical protein